MTIKSIQQLKDELSTAIIIGASREVGLKKAQLRYSESQDEVMRLEEQIKALSNDN